MAHLEAYGFTYIKGALDGDTLTTARQAIMDLAEAQTGVAPNLETGEGHDNLRLIPYLMPRHPVFQDVLMNEKMLALVTYLVGKQCQLLKHDVPLQGHGARRRNRPAHGHRHANAAAPAIPKWPP